MSLLVNPSPGIILLLSYTQCYMWGLILYNNPAFNRIYTQTLRVSCWQSETNTKTTVADCLFEKTFRFMMSAHETHGNSSILNASSNLPLETSVILGLVGYNIFFLIRPINTKRETKASQFIQNLDLLFLFFLVPCVGACRYSRFNGIFLHILPVGFMTSEPGSHRLPFSWSANWYRERKLNYFP